MKILIAQILLVFSHSSYLQMGMINLSISNSELNLLYLNTENIIRVVGLESQQDAYLKSSNNNPSFRIQTSNEFAVRPTVSGIDTLSLIINNQIILTRVYNVVGCDFRLEAQLDSISSDTCALNQILKNPILFVVMPNCYYNHEYRITSFQLSLKDKNGKIKQQFEATNGSELLTEQIRKIKKLESGDILCFENITAICPSCVGRSIDSFAIVVE